MRKIYFLWMMLLAVVMTSCRGCKNQAGGEEQTEATMPTFYVVDGETFLYQPETGRPMVYSPGFEGESSACFAKSGMHVWDDEDAYYEHLGEYDRSGVKMPLKTGFVFEALEERNDSVRLNYFGFEGWASVQSLKQIAAVSASEEAVLAEPYMEKKAETLTCYFASIDMSMQTFDCVEGKMERGRFVADGCEVYFVPISYDEKEHLLPVRKGCGAPASDILAEDFLSMWYFGDYPAYFFDEDARPYRP